jgi:hypothetical protein
MAQPDLSRIDPATAFPRAIAAMQNPGFIKTPKYKEQQWRAYRLGAHPDIVAFTTTLVARAFKLGIPLMPHCIVRTVVEQNSAYARGVSWTPGNKPYPHRAYAVDVIHGMFGWMDQPAIPHAWDVIGHLGKEVSISLGIPTTWGGDWDGDGDSSDERKYDPAHFELANWRELYAEEFG